MVLNVTANRTNMIRFALDFNGKLTILVDFNYSTSERNGLYVNYYDYSANITRPVHTLLREFGPSLLKQSVQKRR